MKKVMAVHFPDALCWQVSDPPPGARYHAGFQLAERVIVNLVKIQNDLGYEIVIVSSGRYLEEAGVLMLLRSQGLRLEDTEEFTDFSELLAGDNRDPKMHCFVSSDLSSLEKMEGAGWQPVYLETFSENTGALTAWDDIFSFLQLPPRKAEIKRKTEETDILVRLNLDGAGKAAVRTGLGFFDHMLVQIAHHAYCDLEIETRGDLHIDEHHTIEDTALALGEAFQKAIGDKRGMERYGYVLPMDDALAQVAIDFSGRNWIVWQVDFKREKIGEVPTEMFYHFFKSFSDASRCNLHIKAGGENEHHKIEAVFKAFSRATRMALQRDPERMVIPSSKGVL